MGWFSKKTIEEKKEEEKTKKTNILDYKVSVWEGISNTRRLIKTFEAARFVDEDKVPFIISEENSFMELYPQDIKHLGIKLNEVELEKKIKEVTEKIRNIRAKPLEEYQENEPNVKDLEFQLSVFEARKRYLKYSEDNNTFIYYDDKGRVCIDYLRKGNSFYPLKCDLDTNTIHTASEPVVKKAGILLRNKENKYSSKKLIETATLILLIILIIGVLANIWLGGWLWKKYDTSTLAETERSNMDMQKVCSEIVLTNARTVMEMQEKYKKSLNGTTDIYVTGVVPK